MHSNASDDEHSVEKPSQIQNQLDLSEKRINKQLSAYLKSENLDSNSNFTWNRKSLADFMFKTYGVKLSQQFVTEAILACRGKELDNSDPEKSYNL